MMIEISEMKKDAKINKLKELRKMMQKRMAESFSKDDGVEMLSKVSDKCPILDEEDEASEEESNLLDDPKMQDLRAEMRDFFQRGIKLEPKGKTKVIMVSSAKVPAVSRKK